MKKILAMLILAGSASFMQADANCGCGRPDCTLEAPYLYSSPCDQGSCNQGCSLPPPCQLTTEIPYGQDNFSCPQPQFGQPPQGQPGQQPGQGQPDQNQPGQGQPKQDPSQKPQSSDSKQKPDSYQGPYSSDYLQGQNRSKQAPIQSNQPPRT